MNKNIIILVFAVILLGGAYYYISKNISTSPEINNFEDCVKAGYPVMESYPRQCKTPSGKNFREDIGSELAKDDLIRVAEPRPNAPIESPLVVKGVARGGWFFEASFPIRLLDDLGEVIASGIATAKGEWMTNDFVPFTSTLTFGGPKTESGKLVLQKDNPSGLPEHDDSLTIPVKFKKTASQQDGQAVCRPTGCSGEVCSDEDVVSICLYRSEFACYKTAKCERQKSGQCGWSQTSELNKCLFEKKSDSTDVSDMPQ